MSEIEKYEKRSSKSVAKNNDTPTLEQSKALFLQGLSVDANFRKTRQLAPSTIITHLAKLAEQDSQY
jgi:hypothetical protein